MTAAARGRDGTMDGAYSKGPAREHCVRLLACRGTCLALLQAYCPLIGLAKERASSVRDSAPNGAMDGRVEVVGRGLGE